MHKFAHGMSLSSHINPVSASIYIYMFFQTRNNTTFIFIYFFDNNHLSARILDLTEVFFFSNLGYKNKKNVKIRMNHKLPLNLVKPNHFFHSLMFSLFWSVVWSSLWLKRHRNFKKTLYIHPLGDHSDHNIVRGQYIPPREFGIKSLWRPCTGHLASHTRPLPRRIIS